MILRLLGTGSADGIPSLHGDDPISRYAREHGGKDRRTRAAAILDGTIKIDLPPDTYMQLERDGLSACDWSALFFTHSDDDHFTVSEIQYSMVPFTRLEFLPYTIFGNSTVMSLIRKRYPEWPMELVETRSFESYVHSGYRVTPIHATHIEDEDCQNLIFEKEGKVLLYATDTGVWGEPTWEFLQSYQLDALVIECTDGFDSTPYEGHLDIKECVNVVDRLRTMGTLRADSRVVTTHHSSRGMATHAQLEDALLPHNIEPGYDGIEIAV